MERALAVIDTPAALAGWIAALVWAPATGFPTWPAAARGRLGSTLVISVAVGLCVFLFVRRLGAALGG